MSRYSARTGYHMSSYGNFSANLIKPYGKLPSLKLVRYNRQHRAE